MPTYDDWLREINADFVRELITDQDIVDLDMEIAIGTDADWSMTIPYGLMCRESQFLTIKNKEMICVTPTIITREVTMWTIGNILIVAIIAAVVFKLMPKLTLSNFFKAVWKLVIRPFKRREKDIRKDWKEAERETRD